MQKSLHLNLFWDTLQEATTSSLLCPPLSCGKDGEREKESTLLPLNQEEIPNLSCETMNSNFQEIFVSISCYLAFVLPTKHTLTHGCTHTCVNPRTQWWKSFNWSVCTSITAVISLWVISQLLCFLCVCVQFFGVTPSPPVQENCLCSLISN